MDVLDEEQANVPAAPGTMSVSNVGTAFVTQRMRELTESDPQIRAAIPDPKVSEARLDPKLGLAQVAAVTMEGYADRPALGRRTTQLITDPATGRTSRRLLDQFETVSYGELWSRTRALASFWYRSETKPLRAGDMICIMAFAGIDFTTVDLAAIHNGSVVVPVQTNASTENLRGILDEVEPRWLATSHEHLATAVDLVLAGHRPSGLLVFDYDPKVDDEREQFEAAQAKLAAAGMPDLLVTLQSACERGQAVEPAPLYAEPSTDKRLCTIFYTSGSTGLPKGAMYPELMLKPVWRMVAPLPFLYMHYMPMNHAMGRSGVFTTLGMGGTCYFTAKSDLSTLFEDIRLVRPTFLGVVTRICEMLYQQYQVEFERRAPSAPDIEALKQDLVLDIRNHALGGRLLSCNFGSAPISPELREFMETCFGFKMDDYYGTTEASGALRNTFVMKPPVIDYKLIDVPELGYFRTDKPYPRGEFAVKTQTIMLGYYKRPEVTASVFDEDGYYKTGDIMAEIGPDRLVYVDRRNNVQKLSQGEFVAISRLETIFTNGHPAIRQVYLYGTSERSYLLGVIVPNEAALEDMGIANDDTAIKAALRDAIKEVARTEELNAYEVPRDFIVEREPFSAANGLLSGMGKYLRPALKARYAPELEKLYSEIAAAQTKEIQSLRAAGRDAPTLETVARAVQAALGLETIDLTKSLNFGDLGGDSLSALTCSMLLEEIYDIEVPASVINNPAGTVQKLAAYIDRMRTQTGARPTFGAVHGRDATEIRASDLKLETFIDAQTLKDAPSAAPPSTSVRTVLLTGANGFLGRFLCLEWLERLSKVGGTVICIARGRDSDAARQRIMDAFSGPDSDLKAHFRDLADRHLKVMAGDLAEPDLGLAPADWRALAETVDLIVHPGALVNHVLPYAQMFGPNVVGTAEIIRLALTHRLKPVQYVSTVAAAMLPDGKALDEDADVRRATPVRSLDSTRYADGYAHSKWAGEVLLREAHDRFNLPVAVFRSNMILAHTRFRGQLNQPDMFTRFLLSILLTGLAPKSFYAASDFKPHYDGLPVDFIAKSVAALAPEARSGFHTYHIANPHKDGISMDTFVDWMIEAGYPIARIDDYNEWRHRFETALRALPEKKKQNSLLPLFHQMREPMSPAVGGSVSSQHYQAALRKLRTSAEPEIPYLTAAFIRKYLDDLNALNLL